MWRCGLYLVLPSPQLSQLLFFLCRPQRPAGASAGGAPARPGWLSSPTLGRANRFLSTAAVSLMTPRRPLGLPEKVKVRALAMEQRTEEDSKSSRTKTTSLSLPIFFVP